MKTLIRWMSNSVRKHGVLGSVRLLPRVIRHVINSRRKVVDLWDEANHVSTAGVVHHIAIGAPGWENAHPYQPIDPGQFRHLLDLVLPHVDVPSSAFVDFGSGRGRPILLASEWPWKHVYGIELSKDLHAQAVANVQSYTGPMAVKPESVCVDACKWPIPDLPIVLYFYDPFGTSVLRQVLENVHRSWQSAARDIWIIYTGDEREWRACIHSFPFLELVQSGTEFGIWRSRR